MARRTEFGKDTCCRQEGPKHPAYSREGDDLMKTIQLSKASRPLAEYARELRDEILVVREPRGPIAAVVPLKGVDRESLALSAHPEFLDLIARSRAQFAAGQTLTLEEMKRAVLPRRKTNQALQGRRKRGAAAKGPSRQKSQVTNQSASLVGRSHH